MSDQSPQMEWKENQRALLNGLLDEIIPASDDGRIPSAGSHHVIDFIAEKAREVIGLGELLVQGLQTMQNQVETLSSSFDELPCKARIALIQELERQEPEFFAALLRLTYMGYYTEPRIPPLFGLSEKPPHPYGYYVPDETPAELAALVEPVIKRGTCYRRC